MGSRIASVMAAGQRGLAQGQARFAAAGQRFGASHAPEAAIEQRLAKHQVEASAALVGVADEMTGTLIDTLA